jgi:sec-independent protein translocase protein TatA
VPDREGLKLMSFGIGEILLVLALVVFFFGAKRIPQIARGVGEGIRNFKQSVSDGKEEGDEDRQLPGGQDS